MLDELGDLADLAIDTFPQLLSGQKNPASVRLKAAIEIAKLVETQRPTDLAYRPRFPTRRDRHRP